MKTEITRAEILSMDDYAKVRGERRAAITEAKKTRRIEVGPDATFYFENYDTMWHQIHEMLFIEKGGENQIADELAAYNPLVPKGDELVATLMFEVDEPKRRGELLDRLGGIEETATIAFEDEIVEGVPEADVERTSETGKASAVQFIHFPFTASQAAKFKKPGAQIVLGLGHPNYGHMAVLPEAVRVALADDLI